VPISRTGWQPLPLLLEDETGALVGGVPLYGKSNSQGEYIFDHSWADAWQRAGGRYYPKLLSAVPFTPAPGPRLLAQDRSVVPELIAGMEALAINNHLSSAHANFIEDEDKAAFEAAGWLLREGVQFHFRNRGYGDFDDFLATLASRKRRAIRKERAAAQSAVTIRALTGADITEAHWDAFWVFYQDTGARKWGRPYLTRAFFSLMGDRMADRILLLLAERDGVLVAARSISSAAMCSMAAIGAAPKTFPSSISSSAIIRRSTLPSRVAFPAWRRARKASTRLHAAMSPWPHGPRTTSPMTAFAPPLPTSLCGNVMPWSARSSSSAPSPPFRRG
jgi:predicted N-acyltransferase